MLTSPSISHGRYHPTSASAIPETRPPPDAPPEPQTRKFKGSSKLSRWSMARTLRSGGKLDRSSQQTSTAAEPNSPMNKASDGLMSSASSGSGSECDVDYEVRTGKSIYMVSDGTGWTAEHAVNAALGQFDYCLVDRGCPVNTHLFSGIDDVERLMEIIKQAALEGAMLVYTLPATLFQCDQEKIFGLTINPVFLQTIRRARAKTLGLTEETMTNYSEMDYVKEELVCAAKIFSQNPSWPVIEVTGKAIEETAAIVLRLYQDRKQRCSMPRISRRY